MTYHELVKKVQTALVNAEDSAYKEHLAVQVNVTGEAEGAFYIEMVDGVLYVAPYDYNDRDALITADGADILDVAQGKITLKDAVGIGKVHLDGDYGKILILSEVIPTKKTRKSTKKAEDAPASEKPKRTRKTAAKKEEAPAEETAPTEKKKRTRKTAAKAEAVAEPVAVETAAEPAPVEKKKRSKKADAEVETTVEAVAESAEVPAEETAVEPASAEKKKRSRKSTASKNETPAADKPKKGRKTSKK